MNIREEIENATFGLSPAEIDDLESVFERVLEEKDKVIEYYKHQVFWAVTHYGVVDTDGIFNRSRELKNDYEISRIIKETIK